MAKQKTNTQATVEQKKLKRQQKALEHYKMEGRWLKWAVIAAVVIIVLLLILLGFATDWLTGLHKDKTLKDGTPISSALDSTRSPGTASGATDTTGSADTATTKTAGQTSDTTSTTTTNNTTTNNTTDSPTAPSQGLLGLYTNSSAGDNLDSILQQASNLGINGQCQTETVIQTCNFTQGTNTVSVKSLLGSGLVTGVTKNF